ncbi:MAG: hypothetical protein BGN88_12600 [Clostridiales bacterium 43-6]|nr:MAG: hypothetical protein BGN88_12600 [Clostridiales bacterium 43-6]
MNKFKYIKIQQDNVQMYLIKMNVDDLLTNSIIERYDSGDDTGYQRQPIPAHFKKISKYLMTNGAILPTAILAALSPDKIKEINESELEIYEDLRIVDGQHRIKGLEELKNGYTTGSMERFESMRTIYEFPVVVMCLTPESDLKSSIKEVDAFININNKGKRVNTNLAKELSEQVHRRANIENQEFIIIDDELITNMSTRIAKELASIKDCFWYNNIILGDAIDNKKPISINAFSKALKPIVSACFKQNFGDGCKIKTKEIEKPKDMIIKLINDAWDIVILKWSDCFINNRYNINYNICKGIGVFPILGLLYECYTKNPQLPLDDFKNIINSSAVKSSDWLVGGRFTGMSSGQSIKQIIKTIKNEAEIELS